MQIQYTLKELYEQLDLATSRSEVRHVINAINDMIQPMKVYYPMKPDNTNDYINQKKQD